MTTSLKMDEDQNHMTERIFNLTLEIIYLLTGEGFKLPKIAPVEMITPQDSLHTPSSIPVSLHYCLIPYSLTPERRKRKKILEVTRKMMELLTGEVPIRCQDVTIYFSTEEWQYLEGRKDFYKEAIMDNQISFSCVNMDQKKIDLNETILNLTLEIIYLLTGESVLPVKSGNHVTIQVPPPHSLISERHNKQTILEVTRKMMELLTGEVPIRCQDAIVYFSMEEWQYIEGHKDLYKGAMMENQPLLTSVDVSSNRNPPERCTGPLYFQDCQQEDPTTPRHYQGRKPRHMKAVVKEEEEETYVRGDQQSMEEGDMMGAIKEEEEETYVRSDQQSMEEGDVMRIIKEEEEETYVRSDLQSMEEEFSNRK
ncbi:oocyte zinc finger protein XlCOF7.1-like [Hyperolius riggenbachi]|uniref:oocyte zinc finger protein XlCOF7.1-like n=1 Tax=Hyperolius riggenbachi TaxID=752182 RepID=UPI0035A37EDF